MITSYVSNVTVAEYEGKWEWIIQNLSRDEMQLKNFLVSNEFKFNGIDVTWRVKFYPNYGNGARLEFLIDDKEDFDGNAQVKVVICENQEIGYDFETLSKGVPGIILSYIYADKFNLYDKETDTMRIPLTVTYRVWQCEDVKIPYIMDEAISPVEKDKKARSFSESFSKSSPRSQCDSNHSEFEIVNHGSCCSDGRSEESYMPVVSANILRNDEKPQDSDIPRRLKKTSLYADDQNEPSLNTIDMNEIEILNYLSNLKRNDLMDLHPIDDQEPSKHDETVVNVQTLSKPDKPVSYRTLSFSEKAKDAVVAVTSAQHSLAEPSDQTCSLSERSAFGKSNLSQSGAISDKKEPEKSANLRYRSLSDYKPEALSLSDKEEHYDKSDEVLSDVLDNVEQIDWYHANGLFDYMDYCKKKNLANGMLRKVEKVSISFPPDIGFTLDEDNGMLRKVEKVSIPFPPDFGFTLDEDNGMLRKVEKVSIPFPPDFGFTLDEDNGMLRKVEKVSIPFPPDIGITLDEDKPVETDKRIYFDRIGNMKKENEAIAANVKISQMVKNICPEKKEDSSSINWVESRNSPQHIEDKNAKLVAETTFLEFYELLYIADCWGSKHKLDMVIKNVMMKRKFEQLFESPVWKNLKDHCTMYSEMTEKTLTEAITESKCCRQ